MKKAKYIYYNNSKVYALYYMDENTLYYNMAFEGGAKLYILVGKDKKKAGCVAPSLFPYSVADQSADTTLQAP